MGLYWVGDDWVILCCDHLQLGLPNYR